MLGIVKEVVSVSFDLVLFISGTVFVPQIIRLLRTKKIQGLSLITFIGFFFIQFTSALHGYFVHNIALLIGMIYCMLTCGVVIILLFYYKLTVNSN